MDIADAFPMKVMLASLKVDPLAWHMGGSGVEAPVVVVTVGGRSVDGVRWQWRRREGREGVCGDLQGFLQGQTGSSGLWSRSSKPPPLEMPQVQFAAARLRSSRSLPGQSSSACRGADHRTPRYLLCRWLCGFSKIPHRTRFISVRGAEQFGVLQDSA